MGTYFILEVARDYWNKLLDNQKTRFSFHNISTYEVNGDLEGTDDLFLESTSYRPSSTNYDPYQFPDKLIPLVILNPISGKPLPVYGFGKQIRDWLYVEDHAKSLVKVVLEGGDGETYNIAGHNEKSNFEVVRAVCSILDELVPEYPIGVERYEELITYVTDSPGHDVHYAIDATKNLKELGWKPDKTFKTDIKKTVKWYLSNGKWCQHVEDGSYQGARLGVMP
jgi:dTDP-glucose 4,6-dehydratase